MKRGPLMVLFLSIFGLFHFQSASGQGFTVRKCDVNITLNTDGYFDVVENYDIQFQAAKHGIYRDIITRYDVKTATGKNKERTIEISNIDVPGDNFEVSRSHGFGNHNVSIKIGDSGRTITGPHHYEIRYRVKYAYLYEDSLIQFYWNIKPKDWQAAFQKIEFEVHLPAGISISGADCFVYSGILGSSAPATNIQTRYVDNVFSGVSDDSFLSNYGQSVTVLIKLPAGSIAEVKPLFPFWTEYGWILIIIAIGGIFYGIWRKFGKDDRVPTTTSYYAPNEMDPAMAGFLINDKEDTSDLIALIPYWATKGFLKIEEIEKDGWFSKGNTKLTKLKSIEKDAPVYQRTIFNGLFDGGVGDTVLISSLVNSFYTKMNIAKANLKKTGQIYYDPKAEKAKKYTGCAVVICLVLLSILFLVLWGPIAVAAAAVTCVVLLILNKYLVKKNPKGNAVYSELKGFKRFIEVAEENKLKMLLKEDPGYFESTMSYALAFGLFDKWAEKFDGLDVQPPRWYSSNSGNAFMMSNFSESFSSSISSAQSTMVSSPSSSGSSSGGGGSSGGGFGGGGGGSW